MQRGESPDRVKARRSEQEPRRRRDDDGRRERNALAQNLDQHRRRSQAGATDEYGPYRPLQSPASSLRVESDVRKSAFDGRGRRTKDSDLYMSGGLPDPPPPSRATTARSSREKIEEPPASRPDGRRDDVPRYSDKYKQSDQQSSAVAAPRDDGRSQASRRAKSDAPSDRTVKPASEAKSRSEAPTRRTEVVTAPDGSKKTVYVLKEGRDSQGRWIDVEEAYDVPRDR